MANRKDGASSRSHFWIDDLHVQPDRNIVMRGDEEIKLEKRLMQVLVEIAENNGKPVSTGALWEEFWSGEDQTGRYDENPVTKAVSVLRKKIGDDKRNPRYIRTIIKLGYCIIPKVQFAEGYRHVHGEFGTWTLGNPYVGLKPFDQGHAEVFQGRSATVADLRQAMREQIDNQRRFVLIVGPSGCGKTSLVHASMIPSIRRSGGFEGLRALSLANCDLGTASDGDLMTTLAVALTAWKVGEREIFSLYPQEHLRQMLAEAPQKVTAVIEESFRRHPIRGIDEEPHAHLLLTIDHAETLVSGRNIDPEQRSCFSRAIRALCDTPRTLTTMIARLDLYPALADALPELADYRCGYGHFEVSIPSEGELAKIIRKPAALAGVDFEEHPKTQIFLDDLLCKKAIAQPDALPLLQHTLHSLYERCGETGLLTYAAYEEIGGLEGAIARRAEEVFEGSPETTPGGRERVLERIFARVVVIQSDSGAVGTSPIIRSRLDLEADQMIQIFIDAHLFISDLDGGQPIAKIAHEALLRQWPRATEWIDENRRLLQAKGRLQIAADRWNKEGRRDDHLLNPGLPLVESREVLAKMPDGLKVEAHAFVAASGRSDHRRRMARKFAFAIFSTLSILLALFGIKAMRASDEADARRIESQRANTFMLKEIARNLEHLADLSLLEKISENAISFYEKYPQKSLENEDRINYSRALRIRGRVRMGREDLPQALHDFENAEKLASDAVKNERTSIDAQFEFAQTSYWLGYLYMESGNLDKAAFHLKKYEERTQQLRSMARYDPELIMEESYSKNNLATLSWKIGDAIDAHNMFTKSLALKEEAIRIRPSDQWKKELADTRSWIGMALESQGRLEDASSQFSMAIEDLKPIASANKDNKEWTGQLANIMQLEAKLFLSRGQYEKAKISITEAIENLEPLATSRHTDYWWIYYLAAAHQTAGDCERALGNREASATHYIQSLEILKRISGDDSDARQRRLKALIGLGQIRLLDGEMDFQKLARIVDGLDRLHSQSSADIHTTTALTDALVLSGEHQIARGETERAREFFDKAIRVSRATDPTKLPPQLMSARAIARLRLYGSSAAAPDIERLEQIGYRHPDYLSMLRATNRRK